MGRRMGLVASLAVLVVVGVLAAPTIGHAASAWAEETGWGNQAKAKLGYGLKNLLLGWTDLFIEPKEAMDAGGNFFVGVGAGVKDALCNTIGGALHTVTFPLPQIDVPLPEGGTQLLSG